MDEVNRRSNLGPSPTSIVKAFGLDFKVGIKSRPSPTSIVKAFGLDFNVGIKSRPVKRCFFFIKKKNNNLVEVCFIHIDSKSCY